MCGVVVHFEIYLQIIMINYRRKGIVYLIKNKKIDVHQAKNKVYEINKEWKTIFI